MAGEIFISYRRDDAKADARSIYQHLQRSFGAAKLFMDVDTIQRGRDFRKVLEAHLAESRVLLVVIGRNWLGDLDERRMRRLDDPGDFVRLEVASALRRDIPVIPILVDGAQMPRTEELPEELKALVFRQAARVTHESFPTDMYGVEHDIRALLESGPRSGLSRHARRWGLIASGAGAVVAVLWVGLSVLGDGSGSLTRTTLLTGQTAPRAGQTFRDCADCPEMVVIPAGRFMMGNLHRVTIAAPFAVGKYEVTFEQWDACVSGGGCVGNRAPSDSGWGRGRRPVINVSWPDAGEFVAWLSRRTGKRYRLLTEAEWEYAARAGTTTEFSTGDTIATSQANFNGDFTYNGSAKGPFRQRTVEVGSFPPNAFGLHDMHGNVSEWVEDCPSDSINGTPADGSARKDGDCRRRILRGGSWAHYPRDLRTATARFPGTGAGNRGGYDGFRVARALAP